MISCAAHKFWAWQSALLSQSGPGALGSKVEIGRVATVLETAWSSQTKSNKCARTFEDYRLLWVKLVMSRLSLAEAELIEWVFTLTNLDRVWPFETLLPCYFGVTCHAEVAPWCSCGGPPPMASPSACGRPWLRGADGLSSATAGWERRDFDQGTKRFCAGNLDDELRIIEDNWGFILNFSVKRSMIRATTQWQWTWCSWQWSQNWLDFSCCWFTICFLMKEVTWSH